MMGFLADNWEDIKPKLELGVDHTAVVAKAFLKPWNHDVENMNSICRALPLLKPVTVLELGTFEGLGTQRMAEALKVLDRKVWLYTVDVGTAPVNSLGESYGVPKVVENGKEVCSTVPWEEFRTQKRGTPDQQAGWGSWQEVIKARKRRVSQGYGEVKVTYLEGYSYDVLPLLLRRILVWDFCFQDTLHHPKDIMKEWVLLKPYSRLGSVIVFDDMNRNYNRGWADWFIENEPDWETRWAEVGHEPLWAERMR